MNEGRIGQLKQFLAEDPTDNFSLYALALEYKESMPKQAIEQFGLLRKVNPHYTALYYHLAETYLELDLPDEAKEVYESGLKILEQAQDAHALKELRNAYQNFIFDYE